MKQELKFKYMGELFFILIGIIGNLTYIIIFGMSRSEAFFDLIITVSILIGIILGIKSMEKKVGEK